MSFFESIVCALVGHEWIAIEERGVIVCTECGKEIKVKEEIKVEKEIK